MLGFDHTEGKFLDMWTLAENLRSDVYTVFVSEHYTYMISIFFNFQPSSFVVLSSFLHDGVKTRQNYGFMLLGNQIS